MDVVGDVDDEDDQDEYEKEYESAFLDNVSDQEIEERVGCTRRVGAFERNPRFVTGVVHNVTLPHLPVLLRLPRVRIAHVFSDPIDDRVPLKYIKVLLQLDPGVPEHAEFTRVVERVEGKLAERSDTRCSLFNKNIAPDKYGSGNVMCCYISVRGCCYHTAMSRTGARLSAVDNSYSNVPCVMKTVMGRRVSLQELLEHETRLRQCEASGVLECTYAWRLHTGRNHARGGVKWFLTRLVIHEDGDDSSSSREERSARAENEALDGGASSNT